MTSLNYSWLKSEILRLSVTRVDFRNREELHLFEKLIEHGVAVTSVHD